MRMDCLGICYLRDSTPLRTIPVELSVHSSEKKLSNQAFYSPRDSRMAAKMNSRPSSARRLLLKG